MLMTAFTIAIAVYSLVSIVLARGRRGRQASLPLLAAASNWFCAVAGLLVVATDRPDSMRAADLELAYGLRAGFWLWLAYATLSFVTAGPMDVVGRPDPLFRTGAGLVAAKLALSLALILTGEVPILEQADCAIGLGIAAFGLVLVENIYDASGSGMRWAVKHLLMALGRRPGRQPIGLGAVSGTVCR